MRRWSCVGVVVLGLGTVAVYGLAGGTPVGTAAPAPAAERPLDGKIVTITCKPDGRGAVLEGVTPRQLGGKTFLVGKSVAVSDDGAASSWAGAVTWLAVEDVVQIMEFKTLDDVRRVYKARADRQKADAPGTGF